MAQLRAFIAIPLSLAIHTAIADIQAPLRKLPCDVKWVKPDAIHLTLKFLGYIEDTTISGIIQAVQEETCSLQAWTVGVRGLGTFPSLRNPRVVWIGLDDTDGRLTTLQGQIDRSLSRLGYSPEERAFTPHLTLGRVRSPRSKLDLVNYLVDNRIVNLGSFAVNRIVLYRSDLRPSGPIYTALHEWEFTLNA